MFKINTITFRMRTNGTNKIAMMPIIATNNKTVQHGNLRSISEIRRIKSMKPIRFVQCVRFTTRAGCSLTCEFARKAYSSPSSQTAFIDTVLYLIPGILYQCGTISGWNLD